MRVMITGFYGWGNAGDEGILQAIMDELGDNEYVVSTTLPFTMLDDYRRRIMVSEVRNVDDTRVDYDTYLLGGGELSWGFGWGQVLSAFSSRKPCMNYAVGYEKCKPHLARLYKTFLEQFNALTVRDEYSRFLLETLDVHATLTMCPTINLKPEKFECPKGMIAVCPRYADSDALGNPGDNTPQIDWFVSRLKDVEDEVLLISFSPRDVEGNLRDLAVCRAIAQKLKNATLLHLDGYSPRKIKYAISQSKLVISGGRYHALVWAAAHNIPFELSPIATRKHRKAQQFVAMHKKYGDKLKEMEKKNVEIFKRVAHG